MAEELPLGRDAAALFADVDRILGQLPQYLEIRLDRAAATRQRTHLLVIHRCLL